MKKLALALLLLPALALGQGIPVKSGIDTTVATVDSDYKALRVNVQARGKNCYSVYHNTGVVAAAAAAGAAVFTLRTDPTGGKSAYIYRVVIDYTTQVAYTTPLSAVRSLVVSRGSGAAASGGTSLDTFISYKDPGAAVSEAVIANGGDVRIATTGALTVTGITWQVPQFLQCHLGASAVGAAGGTKRCEWATNGDQNMHAIELDAGNVLGVRVGPSAMDAAGTWIAAIGVEWCEY
jgi:hypothetical protein